MFLIASLGPTDVLLQHVLSAYHRALGTIAPGRGATRVLRWSVTAGGETGTCTEIDSGDNSGIDTVLGPTREQGILHADELARAAFNAATGASPNVRLLDEESRPYNAYVVKVDPPGGALEYYYIDRETSLLDAREIHYHGHETLITYEDYRVTLGLPFAWHIRLSTDNHGTEDFRLEDMQSGVPIDLASRDDMGCDVGAVGEVVTSELCGQCADAFVGTRTSMLDVEIAADDRQHAPAADIDAVAVG